MSRGPDAGTLLCRALEAAGFGISVTKRESVRWASATFTGARHEIGLAAAPSPVLDAWIGALPEADFNLGNHMLADLAVGAVRHTGAGMTIEIEALTVET